MVKYRVTLTNEERETLETIVSKGSHKSQKVLNSLILLDVDENQSQLTNENISKALHVSMRRIDRVKKRFVEDGLEIALMGHPKEREYERKADGELEAHLVALSCSAAPEGFARWSLRLLADKAVELKYVDSGTIFCPIALCDGSKLPNSRKNRLTCVFSLPDQNVWTVPFLVRAN